MVSGHFNERPIARGGQTLTETSPAAAAAFAAPVFRVAHPSVS